MRKIILTLFLAIFMISLVSAVTYYDDFEDASIDTDKIHTNYPCTDGGWDWQESEGNLTMKCLYYSSNWNTLMQLKNTTYNWSETSFNMSVGYELGTDANRRFDFGWGVALDSDNSDATYDTYQTNTDGYGITMSWISNLTNNEITIYKDGAYVDSLGVPDTNAYFPMARITGGGNQWGWIEIYDVVLLDVSSTTNVVLLEPEDGSQTTTTNSTDFSANLTLDSGQFVNATLKIFYQNGSLYSSNYTTISGNGTIVNRTLTLDVGDWLWNYEVYDDSDNFYTAESNFTITKATELLGTYYENSTIETSYQQISLNVSAGDGLTIGVPLLEYNGTNYSVTKTNLISNTYSLISEFTTPQSIGSVSFRWIIPVTDIYTGTQFTQVTEYYSQTIEELSLGLCSAYETQVLNFTLYDETDNSLINAATNATSFEATFNFGAEPDNLLKNFSTSQLNTALTSFVFCTNTTQDFYTDMIAEYSAVDYTSKNYYLSNATITNSSNNISLYLIPDVDAIQFFVTVKQNLIPLPDAYVQINKFFTGTGVYQTVEIDVTDEGGLFTAYMELDQNYRFVIIKDGEVLGTVDKVSSCKAAPCELELDISSGDVNPYEYYATLFASDVLYNLSYDPTTKIVTFDFIDTTGLATSFRMDISRVTPDNGTSVIYSQELFTSSGTMTYNMSSHADGNYRVDTYISRSPYKFIDYVDFLLSDVYLDLGKNALIVAVIFIIVIVFAFAVKPALIVMALPISLTGLRMIGFINISWTVILLTFIGGIGVVSLLRE